MRLIAQYIADYTRFTVLIPPMNPYWVTVIWTFTAWLACQADNLLQSMVDRALAEKSGSEHAR